MQADNLWSEISTTRTLTAFRQAKRRTEKQLHKKILAEDDSVNYSIRVLFFFSIYVSTNKLLLFHYVKQLIYNAQELEPHCAA